MKLESELKHNGVHEANIKSSRTNARGRVRGQGQIFEAEDKILASRTAWPRGLNITALHHFHSLLRSLPYVDCINIPL